jgi:hypothetical protein
MSYSFNAPCYNCRKKEECQDYEKIRKAINEIHQDQETHKGAGEVVMMCVRLEQKQ